MHVIDLDHNYNISQNDMNIMLNNIKYNVILTYIHLWMNKDNHQFELITLIG